MGMPLVDPTLVDILQDGLRHLYGNHGNVMELQYPTPYHHLIRMQNRIGWDQVHRGRWSREWCRLQDTYKYRQQDPAIPMSGSQWVLQASRLLLDRWIDVWKLRNEARHGRDDRQHQALRATMLRNELEDLYRQKNQVCPGDRKIFHENAETHFQQHRSLDALENWILTYREAIHNSVLQAKKLGIQNNQIINAYPTTNSTGQPRQRTSLTAGPLPG